MNFLFAWVAKSATASPSLSCQERGYIKCNLMINPRIGEKSAGDREIARK